VHLKIFHCFTPFRQTGFSRADTEGAILVSIRAKSPHYEDLRAGGESDEEDEPEEDEGARPGLRVPVVIGRCGIVVDLHG